MLCPEAFFMIIVIPPALYGHVGAILSALIIICCLIGLTVHKDMYEHRVRRDFYCYYTNLSNLVVLLYFSLAAPLLYAKAPLRRLIPLAEFSVTMAILLTHLVFHFVIFPAVKAQGGPLMHDRESRILAVDNLFIHYLVPWLTVLYWVFCAPQKHRVSLPGALLWTLLPLGYALCIFLRAGRRGPIRGTQSAYPYPFLNAEVLGVRRTLRNCVVLYAICALASIGLVLLIRALYALFGGGQLLILV